MYDRHFKIKKIFGLRIKILFIKLLEVNEKYEKQNYVINGKYVFKIFFDFLLKKYFISL